MPLETWHAMIMQEIQTMDVILDSYIDPFEFVEGQFPDLSQFAGWSTAFRCLRTCIHSFRLCPFQICWVLMRHSHFQLTV